MHTQKTAAKKTNRWMFALYTGFFAGLIWGPELYTEWDGGACYIC